MDDRRRNCRIDAFDDGLQVRNSIDGAALGIVGNLSIGGMMLITQRQLQPEGILQLAIESPASIGIAPIHIGAKILWCTPANSPDEFWAGLETIDIDTQGETDLVALLDRLADGH